MRKLLGMLLLVLMVSGCGILPQAESDDSYALPEYETYDDLSTWILNNIQYTLDEDQYGFRDYWATPEETFSSMKGDCEDMALLFLYIVYRNEGIKGTLRCYFQIGSSYGHATSVVNEYEFGYLSEFKYYNEYSYDLAMYRTGSAWAKKELGNDHYSD